MPRNREGKGRSSPNEEVCPTTNGGTPKKHCLGLSPCALFKPATAFSSLGASSSLSPCPLFGVANPPDYISISRLSLGMRNKYVVGRISHVTSTRYWENGNGTGKAQSFFLMDAASEICVTLFNEDLENHSEYLEVNRVVKVTDFHIKTANPKFPTVPGQCLELNLNKGGSIEPSNVDIRQIPFDFKNIVEINGLSDGTYTDFVGVVYEDKGLSDPCKSYVLRQVMVVDKTEFSFPVKVWGEPAKSFDVIKPKSVVIRRGKIDTYEGIKSLSIGPNSDIWFEFDCQEAADMIDWFEKRLNEV